jgi:hypothetical protein
MIITIPYKDGLTFFDVELDYDVVATGGPPAPPFDIKLLGWDLVQAWKVDPESESSIKDLDEVDPAWSEFLADYIGVTGTEISAICRDFELTRRDSVV